MDAAAKEIQSRGGKASVHFVDVTDEGVIALVDAAVEEFGKLDIMVNNADTTRSTR